jgi:hypothetical protein
MSYSFVRCLRRAKAVGVFSDSQEGVLCRLLWFARFELVSVHFASSRKVMVESRLKIMFGLLRAGKWLSGVLQDLPCNDRLTFMYLLSSSRPEAATWPPLRQKSYCLGLDGLSDDVLSHSG